MNRCLRVSRVKEAEAFLSVPKEGLFYPISASNFSDFHDGNINLSHTGVSEQLMSPDRLSSDSEIPISEFFASETPPASPNPTRRCLCIFYNAFTLHRFPLLFLRTK